MAKQKKVSDKEIVKQVITHFGPVIDLRKTPNVLIEILRRHGGSVVADVPDGGVSVAGVGTPPGPATRDKTSLGNVVDNVELMKEILKLSKHVAGLSERIDKVTAK